MEDACREGSALSRFVASETPSPIVDIWVFQQIAPRIDAAAAEFAQPAAVLKDDLPAGGCRSSALPYPEDAANDG